MKRLVPALLFALVFYATSQASIDTITVYSSSMFKDYKCVVVTPNAYQKKKLRFPVVYLLHGWSGSYKDWATKLKNLQHLSDENQLMIVCPEGGYNSWYFDSPVDLTSRYETYISTEVPRYIDEHYRTIANRNARAITGLSMGGHGSLFIAGRHASAFGACGSMSGGLDVSSMKTSFDIPKVLGDSVLNRNYYDEWSVINAAEQFPKDSLVMMIDCGINDIFINMNRRTHEKLMKLGINHTYVERPGKHDWNYWEYALPYQLFFFRNYFAKAANKS